MANFDFLKTKNEYALFARAAIEAERVYATSPAMSAVGSRKALELAVKWVYAADNTIEEPYRDNLQSLIHEPTFKEAVAVNTWKKMPLAIKIGNIAVHTQRNVTNSDALFCLVTLFEFVQWIEYCYGSDYEERTFSEAKIPKDQVALNKEKIRNQQSLLDEKDAQIKQLYDKISQMSTQFMSAKNDDKSDRIFTPKDISEYKTRKLYIDTDLKLMGWNFDGPGQDVTKEYEVENMMGVPGQKGFVDYVLWGKDGTPLAIIEAKRSSKDPNVGRQQACLYADCIERKFGRRPVMFTTNGFETYFWDDTYQPQRKVSGVFSKADLQKLINRRDVRKKLVDVKISDDISGRYYQKEAIRAVCDHLENGVRKHLLVMATGTGKTRTAASLTDVLSRGGYVTNVLFLADRTALVKQAKEAFKENLPNMSLCNLCSNKDDKNARIVFSTYPTMLNSIDSAKSADGSRLFTPSHFDLIIVDESHRSIFNKYKTIFDYFDAIIVGLTATPKTEVDRNTYDFFELENGVPTYAYGYMQAVYEDKVLVPYYNYEVKTKFMEDGITYDELSDEDKIKYESCFEDDSLPEYIPSSDLNKFIFNIPTIDMVLQDLMTNGTKTDSGDNIGKTILFAQNKRHAEEILKRFNVLYPHYAGKLAKRVICDDAYAQTIIDEFKQDNNELRIAVSVDMMDTGIDVPDCVNLVFFKKVKSITKFWQMIGRGTRLSPDDSFVDQIDGEYTGKRRFLIFDYCGNFEYFRQHPNGYEPTATKSLNQAIFEKQIMLIRELQDGKYADDETVAVRNGYIIFCNGQVGQLNTELTSVRFVLEHVEKYRKKEAFTCLSDGDVGALNKHIAPIVYNKDKDENAKRFDNFMYGYMLYLILGDSRLKHAQKELCKTAELLYAKASIPQIRAKIKLIEDIKNEVIFTALTVARMESIRKELRELIQFLVDGQGPRLPIVVDLSDFVLSRAEGNTLDNSAEFVEYHEKVNRYILENTDSTVIYKLTHNMQLSRSDYDELERVLTHELGSREDYEKEYGDTPFGLLVRSIAKMNHDSAMEAFSEFINDESLNQKQISFLHKIINHIELNGYMEVVDLQKAPFDKPASITKLFDVDKRNKIVDAIKAVKNNATLMA